MAREIVLVPNITQQSEEFRSAGEQGRLFAVQGLAGTEERPEWSQWGIPNLAGIELSINSPELRTSTRDSDLWAGTGNPSWFTNTWHPMYPLEATSPLDATFRIWSSEDANKTMIPFYGTMDHGHLVPITPDPDEPSLIHVGQDVEWHGQKVPRLGPFHLRRPT